MLIVSCEFLLQCALAAIVISAVIGLVCIPGCINSDLVFFFFFCPIGIACLGS